MEAILQNAVLKTLSYFHVFEYPLSKKEIWKFLPVKCDIGSLQEVLAYLVDAQIIFSIDNYYCLYNEPYLINRRKDGNHLGKIKLKKAMIIARFLGSFPFVEAVCISGSLSKDFALPNSDLDYFIITAPNRLWTARNFMHLFRKLTFLVNAQNLFCMNYYISLYNPAISLKNMFTAIELSTLKAAWVHSGMKELVLTNEDWVLHHLPNINLSNSIPKHKNKKWVFTRFFEWLINKLGGDKIESIFYKNTMKRWAKKWRNQNYDVEKCMLSASLHFNTPQNYPEHLPDEILKRHNRIYREVLIKYINITNNLSMTVPA